MPIEQTEHFISAERATEVAGIMNYPSGEKTGAVQGVQKTITKRVDNITAVPDENGKTVYYIINYENKGFVIVSADDRAQPVLAYSDKSSFPLEASQYPEGLVGWLNGTKNTIKNIRISKIERTEEVTKMWSSSYIEKVPIDDDGPGGGGCEDQFVSVGPLLTTNWGQQGVYNDMAPNLGCGGDGRAPTGCVATAMSQVMRFHQFPNNYNWGNMPNNFGTMDTAELMRDVGDAVNMNWGCNGSGANTQAEAASSLTGDFGYSSALYAGYNHTTVKNNLNQGRPVILKGGENTGWWIFGIYSNGHAWVCDGYNSSFYCETGTSYLYLHMNWGWDGTFNGMFAFNNWNPGGFTFNYQPGMVYNIAP